MTPALELYVLTVIFRQINSQILCSLWQAKDFLGSEMENSTYMLSIYVSIKNTGNWQDVISPLRTHSVIFIQHYSSIAVKDM